MTLEERESLTQKIGKLMRHERSARHIGNVAEAEAFAAKAQEMMLRYKLDMSDVEAAELEKNEPIEEEKIAAFQLVRDDSIIGMAKQQWLGVLLVGLSKGNFCYVLGSGSKHWHYTLIGRKSDREAMKTMAQYLYEACVEVAEKEAATYRMSASYSAEIASGKAPSGLMRKYRNGFKVGFASAIAERMRTEREILLNDVNEQGLVKLDGIRAEVDNYMKRFGKLHTHTIRTSGRVGYVAGRKYGASVGINRNKRLES